jgi:repressor LexA
MKLLTPRQQEILEFIQTHLRQTGFPPTRAEICKALGFRSPNAAEEHLKALERKGAIQLTAGASRGIRLTAPQAPARAGSSSRLDVFAGLTLPLIGRVAAGSPVLATEHIEQHFQVDTSLFKARPDYLLKVRGLSMRDAGILDGDLLAVKALQGLPEARNGQMVVARLEDEVTVKWFERQGHTVWLKPDNPDYQPIEVDIRRQSLTIEGLGVGIIRGF